MDGQNPQRFNHFTDRVLQQCAHVWSELLGTPGPYVGFRRLSNGLSVLFSIQPIYPSPKSVTPSAVECVAATGHAGSVRDHLPVR